MNPISYTPDLITMVVGAVLSLLFNYFPTLNVWYAALKTEVKSGIMIGLLAVAFQDLFLLPFCYPGGGFLTLLLPFRATSSNLILAYSP